MDAKKHNESMRQLYTGFDINLLLPEQVVEPPTPEFHHFRDMMIETCPCGCGLVGAACQEQLDRVAAINGEMAF